MTAVAVWAALLLIAARAGRISGAVARRVGGAGGRARAIRGFAAGTAVAFSLPALLALLLLGRLDALATVPPEWDGAWGIPRLFPDELWWLGGCLALGVAIGVALLFVLRALGRVPLGPRYRSAAAAQGPGERGAAAWLAVSAGVSEELFFRLALPLAATIVLGSAAGGLALATLAFALAHRHQGPVGVIATGLVGGVLCAVYLGSGALWLAMLLHVAVDLNALVLRPWLFPAEPRA